MENNCKFVSSRGLLKSTTFHSIAPVSSCSNDFMYLIHMLNDTNKMFDGMSIYVCSDLLYFFIQEILPKLSHHFFLVSGDSDMIVPLESSTQEMFYQLINHPFLIKWFSQNNIIANHPKIIQLPIGLDYHTIRNNPYCNWKLQNEGSSPLEQENILLDIKSSMKPFYERNPKIFVNFSIHNDKFHQRKKAFEEIPEDLMDIQMEFQPRTLIWDKISETAFVLSPFGMGMDCHRTWEALILGSIPILCDCPFTLMFDDLPVLIVKKWSDINLELLKKTIGEFQKRTFNYNKLNLKYWTDMFSK